MVEQQHQKTVRGVEWENVVLGEVTEQDAMGGVKEVEEVIEQDVEGEGMEQVIEQYMKAFSKITIPYSDVIIGTIIGQGTILVLRQRL